MRETTAEIWIRRDRTSGWMRIGSVTRCLAFLLIGVFLVSCSTSSGTTSETTVETVPTTQPRQGRTVTNAWLREGKAFLALPSVTGGGRTKAIQNLAAHQAGLVDFLARTRGNPDPLVSSVGADWIAELASAVDDMLVAVRSNDNAALAIAAGKYEYLRSEKKTTALFACLRDERDC